MAGLRGTIARLERLRRRFGRKLYEATRSTPRTVDAKRLQEVTVFGTNPGDLRMFVYVPQQVAPKPALVIALHGCTQTAEAYNQGCGWSDLADRVGFVVIFPQQQPSNNPKNCFSWFRPSDITRGRGEAHSIRQMIERAAVEFAIDRSRVFVTGLSAGGAMASVMLTAYPEVFAGGAIIAGLPYGCASSVEQAFELMFNPSSMPSLALGDRVRGASGHRGPWPKISVWHGTADTIVRPANAENIIRQWTDVHGLAAQPSLTESSAAYARRTWNDANGATLIEAFSIAGMAHGVPLARTGTEAYGAAGPFFLEAGISSTERIARFWGLSNALEYDRETTSVNASPAQTRSQALAAVRIAERIPADAHGPAQRLLDSDDPNAVIAAAFKAADLPTPGFPDQPQGKLGVDPAPIIQAALRAAGLTSDRHD
jgi:poly(hydroxyalkanoate) depolymerase family esterase